MLIPSIDIMNGQAVQLVGGKRLELTAGDPLPLLEQFGRVGEVAVIDLDAAMGTGSNAELIRSMLPLARCRVGGGIRDISTATQWLDAGAAKIIVGTQATPEFLSQLPRERLIAALDAVDGDVVDHGWTRSTGDTVLKRLDNLKDYVDGFLLTFVEREGTMTGLDWPTIKTYLEAVDGVQLTIAGGVQSTEEIAKLDGLGADAQVGMALYKNQISLAESFASVLRSDRNDGLWPTVVVNPRRQALGLVYSSLESLEHSLMTGEAAYHSRKRGLWVKGRESGNTQSVIQVEVDCDRDALCFVVQQQGTGFCHLNTDSCFGDLSGLASLTKTLRTRMIAAPEGSYTHRLLHNPELLAAKIQEEALEFLGARTKSELVHEAADLMFFMTTRLVQEGIDFSEIENELDRRRLTVTRRPGDAKPLDSSQVKE